MRLGSIIFTVALWFCSLSSLAAYSFEDAELQSWVSFEKESDLMAGIPEVEVIMTPQLRSANSPRDEEQLSQKLSEMVKNLDVISRPASLEDGDGRDLNLLENFLETYCKNVEHSLNDMVNCTCRYQWLILGVEFRCWSYEKRVDLHGFSGRPKYQGLLDLNLFKQNIQLKAKVCLDQTKYEGEDKQSLCVAGAFCAGRGTDAIGLCGCLAKYGDVKCSCVACTGGISVNCGFYFLQNVCIPFPPAVA